jgi:hypothetical protein
MNTASNVVEAIETEYKTGFHVIGRRWFRRGPGGTYHTAEVWHDDKFLFKTEQSYGGGDQFLESAMEKLERLGHIAPRRKSAGTLFWRETLLSTYEVHDVKRMRDM